MPLADDEGLAGFALRVERVELLLEPLLGGFAGVDGATDGSASPRPLGRVLLIAGPAGDGHRTGGRLITPKNRGPDHCTPVIRAGDQGQ